MRINGLLDALPLWGVFIAILFVVLISVECGYRLGKYRRSRHEQEKRVQAAVRSRIPGAIWVGLFAVGRFFSCRYGLPYWAGWNGQIPGSPRCRLDVFCGHRANCRSRSTSARSSEGEPTRSSRSATIRCMLMVPLRRTNIINIPGRVTRDCLDFLAERIGSGAVRTREPDTFLHLSRSTMS